MRRSGIVLFLFCVIGLLAALSAAFPSGGVRVAGLHLRFPSVTDVIAPEEEPEAEDPAVLLEKRKLAAEQAVRDNFAEFIGSDPARIYFPSEGPEYLDPVFERLDSARVSPVRIVHFGDSQIEEDRISSGFRRVLQERFGGSGPGFMPASQVYTLTARCTPSVETERYTVYGNKAPDGAYGPLGEVVKLDTTLVLSYSAIGRDYEDRAFFDRLTLLSGGGDSTLVAECAGRTAVIPAGSGLHRTVFELADSSFSTSLVLEGRGDIYGVLLDSETGVRVDNIAMRGYSGEVFTSIPSDMLSDFFRSEGVALVVLQFGGNSIPFSSTTKAVSAYASRIRRQLSYLARVAPDVRILFIGPSDMATRVNGVTASYPVIGEFVDSLRNAVTGSGAAYWDLYSAMGGRNSMLRWVESDPPLAGSDYVHFTPAGAERVASMLSDTFLLYYDYYHWRKEHD